jgi:anionic cell wall polymer biosynthesis LytR-Cps2A-Psr (LCP) family protein
LSAFVRFRHTDTDIVRNARQQDFLRWAKDGYSADQLFSNETKLMKIFGANTQTDHSLHTVDGLIDLGDLLINADKLTLKSIPFPAQFSACNSGAQTPCYVTATPAAMRAAYQHFITPTTAASTASSGSSQPHHTKSSASGLVADVSDGRNQALDLGKLGIPVYYPKLMPAATDRGNRRLRPRPASTVTRSD